MKREFTWQIGHDVDDTRFSQFCESAKKLNSRFWKAKKVGPIWQDIQKGALWCSLELYVKGKGKAHPRTGHEGPEGE
jgi:hypothetical protein